MQPTDSAPLGPQSNQQQTNPTQPQASPQGGGSWASSQQMQPMAGGDVQSPSPKRGMLKWAVIALVVLIVIGGVLAIVMRSGNKNSPTTSSGGNVASHQSAELSQLTLLGQKASSLTDANLTSFNKTDLFFGIFRNAAQQPAVTTTRNYYQTKNLNDQPDTSKIALNQTGYDYHTQQLTYQDSTVYAGTNDVELDRCMNGTLQTYSSLFSNEGWKAQTGAGSTDNCTLADNIYINDGLNTGGLTTTQADKFVNALRGYDGLVTVDKLGLASFQGKSYLRFDVTVHVLTLDGNTGGLMYFAKAFGATGLDSAKWPYALSGALASGVKLAYFVDPTTKLPVYAQSAYTPPTSIASWDNNQILYTFGSVKALTMSTSDVSPLSIAWPVETLQQ